MVTFQHKNKRVLAVGAHPDDVEFLMAGTLVLLHQGGYDVHIASICNGDKGSATLAPKEIAAMRFEEATRAAAILDASFECLDVPDLELVFENRVRAKVVELVRKHDPFIVITMSPEDYMPDHEITSYLLWDGCFNASVPNYKTGKPDCAEATKSIPHLYYADSVEGVDRFGRRLIPDFYVNVTGVIDIKERMLAQHESQRSWLKFKHGMDEYLLSMRRWCQRRGEEANVGFAEAFRQHKGHPFPRENFLQRLVHVVKR